MPTKEPLEQFREWLRAEMRSQKKSTLDLASVVASERTITRLLRAHTTDEIRLRTLHDLVSALGHRLELRFVALEKPPIKGMRHV